MVTKTAKKKSDLNEEPTWDQIGKAIGTKMEKNCKDEECMPWNKKMSCHVHNGCGGAIYGLGFLGALVYYLTTATSFWMGVIGVLKAIIWPAIVVYGLLKSIGL
jgi:hypothetical protein